MSAITAIFFGAFLVYGYFFFGSVREYWFNPLYTTDDALQQLYPLYEALNPRIFANDIVTDSMRGYLAPLHYWISYYLTRLTGDPNIAGHWLHLFMLVATLLFLFLTVKRVASAPAAIFSVFWYLHTRNLVQRMTCGLPRGWGGPIIAAYLYFLVTKNHWAVIATILLGTLLNPPAAFLIAAAYGIHLFWLVLRRDTRTENMRAFSRYLIVAPIIAFIAAISVARPPEIGTMVSYKQAEEMPGFSRRGGRFPFIPMKEPLTEIRHVGIQAFVNRWWRDVPELRASMIWIVFGGYAVLVAAQFRKRRELFPTEFLTFALAIGVVYTASRLFAYKLYVPDRHLQFPLNTLHIVAFPVALWRLFHPLAKLKTWSISDLKNGIRPAAALGYLGCFLFLVGGTGLEGTANFNSRTDSHLELYTYLRTQTPETSLIASNPSKINALQLFAQRKGYMSTETAHPFYDKYYEVVKHRVETSFRAYFSRTAAEFLSFVEPEKIDYFLFFDDDFTPARLKTIGYDEPFKTMVRQLARSTPREQFFFAKLPMTGDPVNFPFVPFRFTDCLVVDVKALRQFLLEHPERPL